MGEYNVLDIIAAQKGIRSEIWHGWTYARTQRGEFEERKKEILDAVNKQLAGFCIFIANIGIVPRILERIEASIMNTLYQEPPPMCDIPDKDMHLSPRWDSEDSILVRNNFSTCIHGLPPLLEV